MKKVLRTLLVILLAGASAQAQFLPFNQVINFNVNRGIGNDTTAIGGAGRFFESPKSTGAVGRFFPDVTNGAYILRALCYGNGQFNLSNDVLTMTNSTDNPVIKYAAYKIDKAAPVVKFSFTLDLTNFSGENANAIIIAFGNAAGGNTLVSSSAPFTTDKGDIFGAFRMIKSGSFVTQFRNGDGAGQTNTDKYLIKPAVSQVIEIFANSTAAPVAYKYKPSDTEESTILPNTYNVYVDGVKHDENFPKVGISYVETAINALSITIAKGATAESVKISNLTATYPATSLPVSLTSFTGEKALNGIRLNWKTASELNNDHFDVLRSTDGQTFTTLTSVSGNGTSNQVNTYSYLDNAPASGTNYYKLKQVDKDGASVTSAIVVAVDNGLSAQQAFSLSVDGNTLKSSFDASANGAALINVHDLSGKSIFSQSFAIQKGLNNVSVAIPSFNTGIYVATLTQNGKSKSVKFLK